MAWRVAAAVVQRAPAVAVASVLAGAVTQWDPKVADSMPASVKKLAERTGTQGLRLILRTKKIGRSAPPGHEDPQEWAT